MPLLHRNPLTTLVTRLIAACVLIHLALLELALRTTLRRLHLRNDGATLAALTRRVIDFLERLLGIGKRVVKLAHCLRTVQAGNGLCGLLALHFGDLPATFERVVGLQERLALKLSGARKKVRVHA